MVRRVYTERYRLPFLAGVLLSSAERRRPGLGAWSPEVREQLREAFESELLELRRGFLELSDDQEYWEKVARTLREVCFPRYCAIAEAQTALERRSYGLWRNGDLVARGAFAVGGLLVGVLMVKVPFIPIPPTWDLFALATMLAAPFIPDGQVWLAQRRYRKATERIVADLHQAEEQLKLYQPLVAVEPAARRERHPERS